MNPEISPNIINDLKDAWLDHVAVAVDSLEKAVSIYSLLGLKFSEQREIVTDQQVRTAFAPIDGHAHIELLESTDPEGPIGKFIAKKGPGIHHLCFGVPNLKKSIDFLKSKGIQFLYPESKIGAGGKLVNFIHPKSCGGVLIELSESPKAKA